jgi:hypothetical protein
MFQDIGLGEWLQEIDETPVEKMASTLFAIDDDYTGAQTKVTKAMAFVKSKWADSSATISRII